MGRGAGGGDEVEVGRDAHLHGGQLACVGSLDEGVRLATQSSHVVVEELRRRRRGREVCIAARGHSTHSTHTHTQHTQHTPTHSAHSTRLRLDQPNVQPLCHGDEVGRVLGAALRHELAQRQWPRVLPCLAAAKEDGHRTERLHLREVCRPSETLRLLGPVARAREHAAYQGGALGVRAPVRGEHQHLCCCAVLLSECAHPRRMANHSRRLLTVAEVRPRTLGGEVSKRTRRRTQAQCLLHQRLRPLEKRGHARWRAVECVADSVHAREVLHPLDLLQHHYHNLGVQVEETHRRHVL